MASFEGWSFSLGYQGPYNPDEPDLFHGWVDVGTLRVTGESAGSFYLGSAGQWYPCHVEVVDRGPAPGRLVAVLELRFRDTATNGANLSFDGVVHVPLVGFMGFSGHPAISGALRTTTSRQVSGIGHRTPPGF